MSHAPPANNDRTLGEIVAEFEAMGHRGQLAARPDGLVVCFTCHRESNASDVEVTALERIEGVSDPDDMLAVVAVVCPKCSTPGTLVLGYGPETNKDDADVLVKLRPIS